MPTYISLVKWTEQGIRDLKESLARADSTADLAESVGGKLVQLYWTVGPYDIVAIFEAPDDETAAAMQLTVGSRGAVRTTTLRAFERESRENHREGHVTASQAVFACTRALFERRTGRDRGARRGRTLREQHRASMESGDGA